MIGGLAMGVRNPNQNPSESESYSTGFWTSVVPAGKTNLNIKYWGSGAGASRISAAQGYGAGSGGYGEIDIALDAADAGKLISMSIYPPGNGRTAVNGSGADGGYTAVTAVPALVNWTTILRANGGKGSTTSANGDGGTAELGDVNTTGGAGFGTKGGDAPNGGLGGVAVGANGATPGGGGAGGALVGGQQFNGGSGGEGRVTITWS